MNDKTDLEPTRASDEDEVTEPTSCRVPTDEIHCPICAGRGVPKNQKWFCERCEQLLMTCCD